MKPYELFSYAAGCSAVFLMMLLVVLALTLSPRVQSATAQRASVDAEQPYRGNPNTVEQFVQIIEPETVPQEVYITN